MNKKPPLPPRYSEKFQTHWRECALAHPDESKFPRTMGIFRDGPGGPMEEAIDEARGGSDIHPENWCCEYVRQDVVEEILAQPNPLQYFKDNIKDYISTGEERIKKDDELFRTD